MTQQILQQNSINHEKADFTTKQHKLYVHCGDTLHAKHMPDVEIDQIDKFEMSPHVKKFQVSPHLSCTDI